jgi:predicted metal-binding membrane protein
LLLLAAAVAWLGVGAVAGDMDVMTGTMGVGFAAFAGVWTLMMTAMMLPGIAPFASFYTRTFAEDRAVRLTSFSCGYLVVWSLAALPAFGLAWLADEATSDSQAAATGLAAAIFLACGVYQLTPYKERCLAQCRSPLGFTLKCAAYRGRTRDFRVGMHHGAFCVACCWSLMALLVVFGLMNVAAMLALTAVMLVEKTWPRGPMFGRIVGGVAVALALVVIFVPRIAPGLEHVAHTSGMGRM